MTESEELLAGREERAERRRDFLSRGAFAVQIALNIPGWPKHIEGEEKIIVAFHNYFIKSTGIKSVEETIFSNAAGLCCLMLFDRGSAKKAKASAVMLVEEKRGGLIADIDVFTKDGVITRADIGLPPRRCIVCGKSAKVCAESKAHSEEDARTAAEKIAAQLTHKNNAAV